MPCVLRPPTVEELPTLSALCLRSKAVWGCDEDFIEACRSELTIEPCDMRSSSIAMAEENGRIAGVVQIKVIGSEADLLKLFVEPTMLRGGVGMKLFHWAIQAVAPACDTAMAMLAEMQGLSIDDKCRLMREWNVIAAFINLNQSLLTALELCHFHSRVPTTSHREGLHYDQPKSN